MDTASTWESRCTALWNDLDNYEPAAFVRHMQRLASELPSDDPIALFEVASAQDSTGHPDLAVPLYRAALNGGLPVGRRRRATIQLASSLRNLGFPQEVADLLETQIRAASEEVDGSARAFLALSLADLGRDKEALGHALLALSRCLPRYNRSLARHALELVN